MVKVRYGGAAFLIGRSWRQMEQRQYAYTLAASPQRGHLRALFSTDTPQSSSSSSSTRVITYLTDVEGDAAYLNRYVQQSKVLHFVKYNKNEEDDCSSFPYEECIDFTDDNAVLVYGGDVWDKGGSDLYVIRQLLDLRKRYAKSNRVHFLMGNRDLNKMRILSELGVDVVKDDDDDDAVALPPHKGVYWLRGTGRRGDPLLDDGDDQVSQTNAADRLKWMLAQTMGSPDAFELRRKELQRENQGRKVTDSDVVASYRHSCHPTGEMGRYLQQAHLAFRLGNILFLHGALPLTQQVLTQVCESKTPPGDFWNDFKFAVPWKQAESNDSGPHSVNEWIETLQRFARDRISGWKAHVAQLESDSVQRQGDCWSTKGGYDYSTSGKHYEELLQYGMGWTPDGNRNPTVVYSSWLDNGLPYRFFPDLQKREDVMFVTLVGEFFHSARLQLIVSGHQPHGDMPTLIRLRDGQCILCCDTSYSGDTMWWNEPQGSNRTNIGRGSGSSGRGDVAVTEVLIKQDTTTGGVLEVECHGTLSDGSKYDICQLPANSESPVGLLATDGLVPSEAPRERPWWVKAQFDDGSHLVSSGEGFNVWNCVVKSKKQ